MISYQNLKYLIELQVDYEDNSKGFWYIYEDSSKDVLLSLPRCFFLPAVYTC